MNIQEMLVPLFTDENPTSITTLVMVKDENGKMYSIKGVEVAPDNGIKMPICTACQHKRHPDNPVNTGGPVHGPTEECQVCGGLTTAGVTDWFVDPENGPHTSTVWITVEEF